MLKTKGMTLFETLLSSALLLMISVAVLLVFQTTMREYRFKSQVSDTLRNNSIGLSKLTKELMLATAIYCPSGAANAALNTNSDAITDGYAPLNINGSLAFNIKLTSGEDRVVGYYLDSQQGEIRRVVFDQTATDDPSTWLVADPANQITKLAYVSSGENFRYDRVVFKFDRAYKNAEGHSPNPPTSHTRQILVIGIVMKRAAGGGIEADYPLTTKVWLERNDAILSP